MRRRISDQPLRPINLARFHAAAPRSGSAAVSHKRFSLLPMTDGGFIQRRGEAKTQRIFVARSQREKEAQGCALQGQVCEKCLAAMMSAKHHKPSSSTYQPINYSTNQLVNQSTNPLPRPPPAVWLFLQVIDIIFRAGADKNRQRCQAL